MNIPIGLINNAWGGSPAEVWATRSVFEENEDLKKDADSLKETPWSPVTPSYLYNGMVHALTGFKIAGTIWYQGESNVSRHGNYTKLFSKMVESWRKAGGTNFLFIMFRLLLINMIHQRWAHIFEIRKE